MYEFSISVVTYNNEKEILSLLESIYKFTSNICFKIFVIDNNSDDNTVNLVEKNYPEVEVVRLKKNIGFGKAHNLVLEKIESEFHLIINPDVIITSKLNNTLISYLKKHDEVVIVTPKILNPDGSVQSLPKKDPKLIYMLAGKLEKYSNFFSKIRKKYTMYNKELTAKKPFCIDFCTGCFMMIRTKIFKKLKGFDDRFFMYLEDADLSRRARKYGKIVFLPTEKVVHFWHRESSRKLKFFFIHLKSTIKYLVKWKMKSVFR